MGRRAATQLDGKTARLKLAPRRQSYFTQVDDRITLGYVRREDGAGSWTRRERLPNGRYTEKQFATADDYAAADGVEILSFVQARTRVAADGPKPTRSEPITANAALDAHFADLATRSEYAAASQQTAGKWIRPGLGKIRVARLTKEQIEACRAGLVRGNTDDDPDGRRRSQNTANRTIGILRAGLNLAVEGFGGFHRTA